jgi:hypothetical protein
MYLSVLSPQSLIWSDFLRDFQESAWVDLVDQFNEGLPISCFSLEPGVENYDEWTLIIQTDASTEYVGFCVFLIPYVTDEVLACPGTVDVTSHPQARLINVGTRRLNQSERLYVAHDREALGIFHALTCNRKLIYLFGEAILQTDNKTALSRIVKLDSDDTSTTRGRRWIRWISDLSDILFCSSRRGRKGLVTFAHLSGPDNCLADYLSRYVLDDLKISEAGTQTEGQTDINWSPQIALTTIAHRSRASSGPEPDTVSALLSKWELDDRSEYIKKVRIKTIHELLRGHVDGLTSSTRRLLEEVCQRRFTLLPNGSLQFHNNNNPVVVVPDVQFADGLPLRTHIIKICHEDSVLSCHRGELATRSQVRRSFWWPSPFYRGPPSLIRFSEDCQGEAHSFVHAVD